MNPEDKKYFERMSRFPTPIQKGHYDDSYDKLCKVCCEIRNTAKDSLREFELKGKRKLSRLLEIFKKLDNEKFTK